MTKDEATKAANKLRDELQTMFRGLWKIRVWENTGVYYFHVSNGHIKVSPSFGCTGYITLLGDDENAGDPRFSPSQVYPTGATAVQAAINLMRSQIQKDVEFLRKVEHRLQIEPYRLPEV